MIGLDERPSELRSRAAAELRALLAAVAFLTRLPLGQALPLGADDVARAAPGFPVAGAAIGAAVGGLAAALEHPLSPLLAAALAVAAGTLLTGALHLDALADTADALGAGWRERALRIMREPTIGAFGAAAVALDVLVKAAALTALAERGHVVRVAVVAGALSRCVPVLLAASLPYARAEDGVGAAVVRGGAGRAVVAAGVALAIAVTVAGGAGAELAACLAALALSLGLGFRRWLGGVTGDTLGAAIELSETVALVVAVALVGRR